MGQGPIKVPPAPLDFDDIQADVILGIPKRAETFLFFRITDATEFRKRLGTNVIPLITTTTQVQAARQRIAEAKEAKRDTLVPIVAINLSFSANGLDAMGIRDDLGDKNFSNGQRSASEGLGDRGVKIGGTFHPAWLPQFTAKDIHGVFLIAGDSVDSVRGGLNQVLQAVGPTIREMYKLEGATRPDAEKGHEHFGFADGISLPAVKGVGTPLPGQQVVRPGILLLGLDGDPVRRPDWAKNGSFLVFRQLNQLVPEFNDFLDSNPFTFPGLTREQGSALLGARMVGRWKSGAPIDVTPLQDDPALAANPQANNNFDFSSATDQSRCPFAAHIRKTNPRSDLAAFEIFGGVETRQINRQGITFGPEVTTFETTMKRTEHIRGLAFVCYQSVIANGFEFIQKTWANDPKFIFGRGVDPGFDPIIGANGNQPRVTAGMDFNAQATNLSLPINFVDPKGGEYFFTPSILALKNKFATASTRRFFFF